jgi:hypothetical protein
MCRGVVFTGTHIRVVVLVPYLPIVVIDSHKDASLFFTLHYVWEEGIVTDFGFSKKIKKKLTK